MRYLFVIGIAFILDLIFGDPYWLLHPVCIIGKTISALEKMLRKIVKRALDSSRAGYIGISFFCSILILYLANTLNYYLAMGIEIYFCNQIFAVKSLKKESMNVYYPLNEGNYPEARKYLSYIVGRDTQNLDAKGITKATVETIAENTTDGVVAPLFIWQ